jgi:hypothetical protein
MNATTVHIARAAHLPAASERIPAASDARLCFVDPWGQPQLGRGAAVPRRSFPLSVSR